jgi:hypothetical protein
MEKVVRNLPHGDVTSTLVKSVNRLQMSRRRQEPAVIPHNIQHGYNVIFANANNAQQALASGNQPATVPQVDMDILDDGVEDLIK